MFNTLQQISIYVCVTIVKNVQYCSLSANKFVEIGLSIFAMILWHHGDVLSVYDKSLLY